MATAEPCKVCKLAPIQVEVPGAAGVPRWICMCPKHHGFAIDLRQEKAVRRWNQEAKQ